MSITKQDALDYHRNGRPGKIEVTPTKPLATQRDLSLAYSPGVAEAVLEIDRDPMTAYELTARANLVAVVSNGTAILGLGNRGPLAAKPVMEGKGVLFKRFADIDVFDIEINAPNAEDIINACRYLAPTFGGINLEDIAAPDCFIVEETLKKELDIPVFHDDQHGTAIISGAALINACEVTGRKLADLRVVINGAGASAIATGRFYITLGVRRENIIMVDSKGVIYKGRDNVNQYKAEFAIETEARTLADAMVGADMVLGLSVAGSITKDMVASMADEPLIFVLANPTPEIMPEEALAAKPNAIIGTGRSDYSNQINNVLGFPFIFRGALDVYASEITETMKMAAAKALAALAHEDVPDSVLSAYGQSSLKFGRDYLIPKPLDPRVLLWVAPAVAQGAIESGVARREIDIEHYKNSLIRRQGAGRMVRSTVLNKAKAGPRMRIVYGEGEQPKVIRAAYQVQEEGIGTPILLGEPDEIHGIIAELGLHFQPKVITPRSEITNYQHYVDKYLELRQRRGVTRAHAGSLVSGRTNFGLMMVLMGDGDAFVSGLTHEYPDILRPALRLFGTRPGVDHASGIYLTIARDRVYVFTDATVNVEPDAATLAEIAVLAADFTRTLGIEPRVAMLSFSNFGGTHHPLAEKVTDAVRIVNERRPDIVVDGEMQADTAVVPEIIDERYPFSRVRDANVLVFPDLGSANIAYKLLDRLTEAEAIGPVLLGLGAPVQVIQAGDDVDDIVALSAFAALDSQQRQGIHHVEELESDLILDGR